MTSKVRAGLFAFTETSGHGAQLYRVQAGRGGERSLN